MQIKSGFAQVRKDRRPAFDCSFRKKKNLIFLGYVTSEIGSVLENRLQNVKAERHRWGASCHIFRREEVVASRFWVGFIHLTHRHLLGDPHAMCAFCKVGPYSSVSVHCSLLLEAAGVVCHTLDETLCDDRCFVSIFELVRTN